MLQKTSVTGGMRQRGRGPLVPLQPAVSGAAMVAGALK